MSVNMNVLRRSFLTITPQRTFASTSIYNKSVTETVKEAAEKVNRLAGDAALKGIDVGESATQTIKDSATPVVDKIKEVAGDATAQAKKTGIDAQSTAENLKGETKKVGVDAQNEFNKSTSQGSKRA